MKKLRVTVEGKTYEVLVEVLDEGVRPAPAAAPALPVSPAPSAPAASAPAPVAPAPASAAKSPGDVPSPLAGKIVSIDVQPGQSVAEGAQVATIEAMKMNTYIFAPKAGRVEAVFVHPGDGVDEGAPLLRIV